MKSICVAFVIAALSVSAAMAGNHSNNDMGGKEKGAQCFHTIHEKHPAMKGAAFRAEWDKCKADPTGYFQGNS